MKVWSKMGLLLVLTLLMAHTAFGVTLEVWSVRSAEQDKIIQEMVDTYFTPKTGINVEFLTMTYDDLWQKGLLAMASGDTPDLATFGSEWPVEFGIRGGLIDLAATFGDEFQELRQRVYPGLMRSVDFLGTTFGIPENFGFSLAYYRTDIFDDLGLEPPSTWKEMTDMLPRLRSRGYEVGSTSHYLVPSLWYSSVIFGWQHGIDYVNDDLVTTGFDSPAGVRAFTELMELFTVHKLSQEWLPLQAFASGDFPFVIGGNWHYTSYAYAYPQLAGKWGMSMIPGTQRDGIIDRTAWNGPMPFGIFTASRHKKEAWEFIKWFLSTEVQVEFANRKMAEIPGSFYLSAIMEVVDGLNIPEKDRKIFYDQAMNSKSIRYGFGSIISTRYLQNAMMEVLLTGSKPEASLQSAVRQIHSEMSRKQHEFSRFVQRMNR